MGPSRFTRTLIEVLLIAAGVSLFYLAGCSSLPLPTDSSKQTLTTAGQQAGDTSKTVAVAATQVSGTATQVIADANAGRAATPPAVLPLLAQYWTRIIANGQILMQQGANLDSVSQQLAAMQGQIELGNKQSEDERTAMQKKLDAVTADLADAKSATQKIIHVAELISLIVGGLVVAWGLYKLDFHLVTAGVGGTIAVVGMCIIVGEIDTYKLQILIGMGVALAGAVAFEVYRYMRPANAVAPPSPAKADGVTAPAAPKAGA
jgi:hypothetical protein